MDNSQIYAVLHHLLLLPIWRSALEFTWGAAPQPWITALKRGFLILPLMAIVLGYWVTLLGLPTLIVRNKRRNFFNSLLVTWWDLGRSIFMFWGGVFKFALVLSVAVFGLLRLLVLGLWLTAQDIVLIPFRLIGNLGNNLLNPSIPWVAVAMTLLWCLFEAGLFTYVMSPLVLDTLSNLTGDNLSTTTIRIPLFLFMLFISLGSYSVLSTWSAALKSRDVAAIVKIGAIELVALFVEVVFLYREFVDALVPWFAQHSSGKFDLGIGGTLLIAGATWFGIRSLSWFLFASSGTPTLMAVIQGTGLQRGRGERPSPLKGAFSLPMGLIDRLKSDAQWVQREGEKVLGSFILPPLQVLAGALNFLSLLFTGRHLFDLPFRDVSDLKDARALLQPTEPTRGGRKIAKAA
jgi:hypothetical protein